MKNLFKTFTFMMAAAMFVACGDDNNDPTSDDNTGGDKKEVVADFDFVVEEGGTGKVTFTNKSENASTYEWTFGDEKDGMSVLKDPVYTYETAGTYKVALTAADADGNYKIKEKEVTIVISKPEFTVNVMDHNYDEWKEIPSLKDQVSLGGGFKDLKIVTTNNKVYIYLEGDETLYYENGRKISIGVDIDNNVNTGQNGAGFGMFPDSKSGADVYKEVAGFHVWGLRPNGNIGNSWIEDGTFLTGESEYDQPNKKTYFEWALDLVYARTCVQNNSIFQNETYKNDPQFAKSYSEDEIKMYIWVRDPSWNFVGRAPLEGQAPFSVKLNQYVVTEGK